MKRILIALALMTFGLSAQAGIYLEPYLGYATGNVKQSDEDPISGTAYGLKLGYSMLGFAYGGEYQGTSTTIKDESGNITSTGTDLGLFVGYTFPILLKAQASYFLSSESKGSSTPTVPALTAKGKSYKIGVGYTGLPFIAINLDYIAASYDKYTIGGVSGTLSPSFDAKMYMLSISLPLDL